jgi:hypothetical protein
MQFTHSATHGMGCGLGRSLMLSRHFHKARLRGDRRRAHWGRILRRADFPARLSSQRMSSRLPRSMMAAEMMAREGAGPLISYDHKRRSIAAGSGPKLCSSFTILG